MQKFIESLSVILIFLFNCPSWASDPEAHPIGPITSIQTHDRVYYSASQSGVLKHDADSTETLIQPSFRVFSIAPALNEDNQPRALLIGGGVPGQSGVVGLLDLKSMEFNHQTVADDLVYAVAARPAQGQGAAACADGRVIQFTLDPLLFGEHRTLHVHTAPARCLAYSKDGEYLVSGGLDGNILATPLSDPQNAKTLILQDHTAGVECLAFSPDGQRLVSGSRDAKARVHDSAFRLVRTYSNLHGPLGLDAYQRTPWITSILWNDKGPIAGNSIGEVMALDADTTQWNLLRNATMSPVFSMARASTNTLLLGEKGAIEKFTGVKRP